MVSSSGHQKTSIVGILLFLVLFAAAADSRGGDIQIIPLGLAPGKNETQKLSFILGKSAVLKSTRTISRLSEPDPKIATTLLLSPNEVYITPKGVGTTNLIVWQDKNAVAYDLEVNFDVSQLKQRLHDVLPLETELRVIPTGDSITLAGRISSTNNLDQAMAIVRSFAPTLKDNDKEKDMIRNLVEVAGVHQVMLEVRVAEVSKNDLKQLGFNFAYDDGKNFVVSMLSGLTNVIVPQPETISRGVSSFQPYGYLAHSPSVNALFRFGDKVTWTGMIDALNQDGIVKILAKPTLITMSGQNASFLAGGEFPIPIPQAGAGATTITIEYRQYGVGLNFLPTVLSPDRINIRVSPDVSELDYKNAVSFGGYVVPGISVRRASTTVEMGDGQSFAIAGLLRNYGTEDIQKFPLLGDLPILGLLFRSSSYQKNETELVIVVTPRLVKPSNQNKQPLPTDYYIEPNFMDMAFPEFSAPAENVGTGSGAVRGKLDGEFGPAMPRS